MTNNSQSPEQILEAAMCAWEEIDTQTQNADDKSEPIWRKMKSLRDAVGTAEMRSCCGSIGRQISAAFVVAEKAAGGFYGLAFDWDFVPKFLARALDVRSSSFYLRSDWRECARQIGAEAIKADVPMVDPQFDKRDIATILAGLRTRQWDLRGFLEATPLYDIASGDGEFDPMLAAEIDALCERVNFSDNRGA